jgi:hypothetical protein
LLDKEDILSNLSKGVLKGKNRFMPLSEPEFEDFTNFIMPRKYP